METVPPKEKKAATRLTIEPVGQMPENRFLDNAAGLIIDHSEAEGEFFDLSVSSEDEETPAEDTDRA
ncbi:hypothetical protein ruthe_00344 [Rubellimicrobium thermophilum DSM 16684]|uniref:Uncharacterized protein n=1 Tax=Rubellimicrobium thermophilum DSM 16684 TaxID=1123069 RepID=S9R6P7_9RHOB|nr:hypothetical protein [Rubellimicrobium thermophilum]EPX87638.1 hypothetical protein ruthe_00344 [Rubellimicrobium thermophilum DSM 16684]